MYEGSSNESDKTVIVASSMSIFLLVVFILGFAGGYCCHKYKQLILTVTTRTESSQPTMTSVLPVTEVNVSSTKQRQQDLEMTENVAYGPLPQTKLTLPKD